MLNDNDIRTLSIALGVCPESSTNNSEQELPLWKPEFKQFVEQRWIAYGSSSITQELDQCAQDIHQWSQDNCQQTGKEIEKYRKKLDQARAQVSSASINYFNDVRNKVNIFLVKDDMF